MLLVQADARAIPLPDGYVQTVITSPPYWKQRNYHVKGQLGDEATPEAYIAVLVETFREVWRVLRPDGTVWLNLGDKSKRKQLLGLPWRVALALQADGWYLRTDVIWDKPNPLPEAVTDRPARNHEYLFLLSRAPKYYYDRFAIREPLSPKTLTVGTTPRKGTGIESAGEKLNAWMETKQGGRYHDVGGRNRRTVWRVSARAYKGTHFATFPPGLVEPCLLAGSPPSCCAACGAPHRRIVERGAPLREQQRACGGDQRGEYRGQAQKDYAGANAQNASDVKRRILAGMVETRTVGWAQTCECVDAGSAQSVVLDPFMGSGTVGLVAHQHGRFFVGQDLKEDYVKLARCRITGAGC